MKFKLLLLASAVLSASSCSDITYYDEESEIVAAYFHEQGRYIEGDSK